MCWCGWLFYHKIFRVQRLKQMYIQVNTQRIQIPYFKFRITYLAILSCYTILLEE